jgi:hypothetical protein
MRGSVLLSAALMGAGLAALAIAQTTPAPPIASGSSETAPASTNGEPQAGKPAESGPESTQGASGGPGNVQAPTPAPGNNATSASPAPGGTTPGTASSSPGNGSRAPSGTAKELATGPQSGKKPVRHAAATSQRHGQVTHQPKSGAKHASNLSRGISPHPPTTSVDENASADQHLRDAQIALSRHRTEEAQEALERAETRVLNSAPEGNLSQNSTVITIERAREAMGHVRYLRPDPGQAGQLIDQALSQTARSSASSASQ